MMKSIKVEKHSLGHGALSASGSSFPSQSHQTSSSSLRGIPFSTSSIINNHPQNAATASSSNNNNNNSTSKTSTSASATSKAISRADYTCRKCRAHNQHVAVKRHKRQCPFIDCNCKKCKLVDQGRQVVAKQIAIYREQVGKTHNTHTSQVDNTSTPGKTNRTPSSTQKKKAVNGPASARQQRRNVPTASAGGSLPQHQQQQSLLSNSSLETSAHQQQPAYIAASTAHLLQQQRFPFPSTSSEDALQQHPLYSSLQHSTASQQQTLNALRQLPEATCESPSNGQPQQPMCRRCRNHGEDVPWKGHKKVCPYRNCDCNRGCQLISLRKNTEKNLRNMIVHDEENSNSVRGMQHFLLENAQTRLATANNVAAMAAAVSMGAYPVGSAAGSDLCNPVASTYHKLPQHGTSAGLLSSPMGHMYPSHHPSNTTHASGLPTNPLLSDPLGLPTHYYPYPSMMSSYMSLENILKVPSMYAAASLTPTSSAAEMMMPSGALNLHPTAGAMGGTDAAGAGSLPASTCNNSTGALMGQDTDFNTASGLFGLQDCLMTSPNTSSLTIDNFSGTSLNNVANSNTTHQQQLPQQRVQSDLLPSAASRSSSSAGRNSAAEKEFRTITNNSNNNNNDGLLSGHGNMHQQDRLTPSTGTCAPQQQDQPFPYFGSRFTPHTDLVGFGIPAFSGFPYPASLYSSGANFLTPSNSTDFTTPSQQQHSVNMMMEDRNNLRTNNQQNHVPSSSGGVGMMMGSGSNYNAASRFFGPTDSSTSSSSASSLFMMPMAVPVIPAAMAMPMGAAGPGTATQMMSWSPLYTAQMVATSTSVDVLTTARFPVAALHPARNSMEAADVPPSQHLGMNAPNVTHVSNNGNMKREDDVPAVAAAADYRSLIHPSCYS